MIDSWSLRSRVIDTPRELLRFIFRERELLAGNIGFQFAAGCSLLRHERKLDRAAPDLLSHSDRRKSAVQQPNVVWNHVPRRFARQIWVFGYYVARHVRPNARQRLVFMGSIVTAERHDKPLRIRSRCSCTRVFDLLRIARAGITTCNWITKTAIVINVASFLRLRRPACIFNSCF